MKPQAFIFIGRSGCGKGTQAELLMKTLREKDPSREVLPIQTGKEFREFMQGPTYSQKKTKERLDQGGLMPEFLTINMWVKPLIEKATGDQHLVFDGTPRKVHEAGALNSCFDFYNITEKWVINIDISDDESVKRLLARKRFDDTEEDIRQRLSWYETDVAPTLEYYDGNPNYHFLKIFGERPVDVIHADIVKKVGLE